MKIGGNKRFCFYFHIGVVKQLFNWKLNRKSYLMRVIFYWNVKCV